MFAAYSLLFGTHIAAWHLGKIGLHLIAVILCFRIAQLLSGSVAVGLLTAAIFAVMPAHVDPVVWISAISEPLSTVFELGALLCLVGRKPGWSRGMLAALALYACAQLTHESAIVFPLIVAAYVFLIEGGADKQLPQPGRNPGTILTRIVAAARVSAPFAVLALVYLCVRIKVLGHAFGTPHYDAVLHALARSRAAHYYGPVDYLMTFPVVLLADLGVLVLPGFGRSGARGPLDYARIAPHIPFGGRSPDSRRGRMGADPAQFRSAPLPLLRRVEPVGAGARAESAFDLVAGPGPLSLCSVIRMEPGDRAGRGADSGCKSACARHRRDGDGDAARGIHGNRDSDRALLARRPDFLQAVRGRRSCRCGISL